MAELPAVAPLEAIAESASSMRATHTGALHVTSGGAPDTHRSCSSSCHQQDRWSLSAAEPVLSTSQEVLSLGEARLSLPNLAPVRVPATAASMVTHPKGSPAAKKAARGELPVLFHMPQHLQSAFGDGDDAAPASAGYELSGVQSLGMSSRSSLTRAPTPLQQLAAAPEGEDGTLLSFFGAESGVADDDSQSAASLEVHHFVVQLPRGGLGKTGADVLQQRILQTLLRPCGV